MFPYRTDAPLYHFPYATIGLIVVNVLAFLAVIGASGDVKRFTLEYGEGLKPLQWVTSNFIHGGLMHLFGNMLALWTFGLLVEGKLGAIVFLPLYLGIGFVQCGVEQAVMAGPGNEGFSFGALPHAAISNPLDAPTAHLLYRAEHGLRAGGFGILFARKLVDEVIHNREGNEVMLVKYLPG